jgi:ribosome-associated protein
MTDATEPTPTTTEAGHPEPGTEGGHDAPESRGLPKRLRGTREAQDTVPPNAVSRTSPGRLDSALDHARICARIAADNRAKDILLLDLRGVTSLVDFFVIASASSRRQAASIGYEIDAEMKKLGEKKLGIEGAEEGRWTLIDYGDFVVHLFSDEARAFYSLEDIWGDAPRLDWHDPSRTTPGDAEPKAD